MLPSKIATTIGLTDPAIIEAATKRLMDPNKHRKYSTNAFVTLYHEDHGVKYIDKVQVYFKALPVEQIDEREEGARLKEQTTPLEWHYVTTKIRTVTDDAPEEFIEKIETLERTNNMRNVATKGALRLMEKYNISLFDIPTGSGTNGKILKSDVLTYITEELEIEVDAHGNEIKGRKGRKPASE